MSFLPPAEISRRLAEQAERVCQRLLPGGRMVKDEWVCGDLSGGEGKSLKVHLSGTYAGNWRDWATDEHGDLLDLWRLTLNLSPGETYRQVKAWLGITDPVRREPRTFRAAPAGKDAPPESEGRVFAWLTGVRKLKPETLALFRVAADPKTRHLIFPCFAPGGELQNRGYRSFPVTGEKKRVWQDTGCAPCLFGWHALPESAYRSRTVLIAEEQIDAMTWHQWGVAALSIPGGSSGTWIDWEWDNLAFFDKILLSFDADGAGQENLRKTVARLGVHRCLLVKLPGKDANECLQAGHTAGDAAQWITEASPPPLQGLVQAADLADRLRAELLPKPEAFSLKFLRREWPHEGLYFRPGEVTVWTGASFHGKSTFLNYYMLCALVSRIPVFVCSPEVRVETTLRRMAVTAYALQNIRRELTPEDAVSFLVEFGDLLSFADVVGFIPPARLLEMMRYAFQRFGALHFVIDSLMRVEGLEEDFPAQGAFMNQLQEFVKQTGAHVHLVAHPRKLGAGDKPGLMDIKGSSLVPNNADNVVVVARNMEKMQAARDGDMTPALQAEHDTEIIVEKQRESGWMGSFPLRFDPRTMAYSTLAPVPMGNVYNRAAATRSAQPAA